MQEDHESEVIKGLYACGECASASVHGANRLGANSLLEIVVMGRAVADAIACDSKPNEKMHQFPSVYTVTKHDL